MNKSKASCEPSEAPLRIVVLPEDGPKRTEYCNTRKGGDILAGYLEVFADSLVGVNVTVVFQGFIRTWLPSFNAQPDHNATAEYKFLSETQEIETTSTHRHRWEGFSVHRLPFKFTIPTELISSRSDVSQEYLNLLPTVKEGQSYYGLATKQLYMQPRIMYVITALSTRFAGDMSSATKCRTKREITVMPSIPASPPLQIEHFPHEYKTICVKNLKRRMWNRPIGKLTISAVEPKALNISTSALRASTVASVRLLFQPCGAHTPAATPYEWRLTVKSHLKVRTFYSTKQFTHIPTMESVKLDPLAEMTSSCTLPEIRQCDTLSWRLHRLSSAGTIASDALATPWTTTLIVPVSASKSLIPTFLSPLSARRYVLVLHITIEEIHHDAIVLEIPVQVICDSSQPATLLKRESSETSSESAEQQVRGGMTMIHLEDDHVSSLLDTTQPPLYAAH